MSLNLYEIIFRAACLGGLMILAAISTCEAKSGGPGSMAVFKPGNLVVCRVGDGRSVLGQAAAPVFLDQFTPTGSFVNSIALPVSVAGNSRRLTVSGNAISECQITRSSDGQYILLAGYDAPPDTLNLAASLSTTNARVIGRVSAGGNVDTSTALSDALSGGSVRGAASTNGMDLWISGNGRGRNVSAINFAVLGSTASTGLLPSVADLRSMNIFGGQLFVSSGQGAFINRTFSIGRAGTGIPTAAGQALSQLPGVTVTISVNSFFFADLSSSIKGLDTLYAADDVAGVIRKYSFNGNIWVDNGTMALAGVTGLTGVVNGTTVTLFVTNPSSLQTLEDLSGYNATIFGTLVPIAFPPDHTEFRSAALAPVANTTITVDWGLGRFARIVTLRAVNSGVGIKGIYFKVPYARGFQFVEGNFARFKVIGPGLRWSFQAFVEDSAGSRSDVVTYSTP